MLTREDKINWLKSYSLLGTEIEALQEELEIWRARATKINVTMSPAPAGTGRSGDKIQTSVEHICQLETDVSGKIEQLIRLRCKIEGAVNSVENRLYRHILKACYLHNKTLSTVAEEIHYSYRQTIRLHDKALDELLNGANSLPK